MNPITWKMNGKDYTGRLLATDIADIEDALGCGIIEAFRARVGVKFTQMVLATAARRMDQNLKPATFQRDFNEESATATITPLAETAMKLLKESGVLPLGEEETAKKD